jgi:hypothetical protein
MEKLIFLILAVPILIFVFYLGGSAIMKGYEAKINNKPKENLKNIDDENLIKITLSSELKKLNDLKKEGILTEEEFTKAKEKIINEQN